MAISVKVETENLKKDLEKLAEKIQVLCKDRVVCGIDNKEKYEDGTSIAQVALFNEYGLLTGNTKHPPRPFLSKTLEDNKDKYYKIVEKGLFQILIKPNMQQELSRVGMEMEQDIKWSIDNWIPYKPYTNTETTQKNKAKKYGDGNSALKGTGEMRDAVKWKLETKET